MWAKAVASERSNLAFSTPEPDAEVVPASTADGDGEHTRQGQHRLREDAAAGAVVGEVGEVAAHEEPVGQQ